MTAYELVDTQPNHACLKQRRSVCLVFALMLCLTSPLAAQSTSKPYDQDLYRLAESLGGIHYLGVICARGDGQAWRQHMQALIDAEGATPRRRADLAKRFNLGYRNYSRTYRTCSETAKAALARFIDDATKLSERILANAPATN